jgi:hypothetical protein
MAARAQIWWMRVFTRFFQFSRVLRFAKKLIFISLGVSKVETNQDRDFLICWFEFEFPTLFAHFEANMYIKHKLKTKNGGN